MSGLEWSFFRLKVQRVIKINFMVVMSDPFR